MAQATMPDDGHVCNVCGAWFHSRFRSKRTCSRACAKVADRSRSRDYQRRKRQAEAIVPKAPAQTRQCIVCGSNFDVRRPGHVMCSRRCKQRRLAVNRPSRATAKVEARACAACGGTFTSKAYQQAYCSPECRAEIRRHRARRRHVAVRQVDVVKTCKECGSPFSPRDARQYLCSVACNAKVQSRIGARTRRARLAGVLCDRIDPVEIFKRDAYRCGICGSKTLASKRGTNHPQAPELDHIVAIALGGSHTFDNVQCSCASCNRRKGAGVMGQLHLFPAE